MNRMATPVSRCISFSRLRYCAWIVTSSAVVGSSAMSSLGWLSMAIPPTTRCFIPPLIWCGKSESRRSGAATRIMRSTSIARAFTVSRVLRPPFRPQRAATDSVSWLPMVNTGFSAVCGSWRIIDILWPRIRRTSGIRIRTTSSPSSRMRPPTMRAASGSNRSSESAVMLLPDPDSPTSPSVSPSRIWKLTPSTARVTPHLVKRWVCRSCTSRTTLPALGPVLLTLSATHATPTANRSSSGRSIFHEMSAGCTYASEQISS